jgi:competence protein ComEA
MRSLVRRRTPDTEQVRAARRRIAALTREVSTAARRSGWVPEVPSRIRSEDGETRMLGDHDAATDPQGDGSPVLDRLPLRLRAAAESLPDGLRRGRFGLERGQAVVVTLVVLLGLAVAALVLGLGRPGVVPVEPSPTASMVGSGTPATGLGGSAPGASSADSEQAASGGDLLVHVAGKVRNPGVVRLPEGSRVLDAVQAAGGAEAGVDLTGLNLARFVGDGEQVLVGIPAPADGAPTGAGGQPAGASTGGLVNLNTATLDQLDTLPGIGPTLAERILQWRQQHGRFSSVDELQEVSGIGPMKFEQLVDLATV